MIAAKALPGSFWPNETQKLLLRTSILDGDASAAAWEQLRPRLRVDTIDTPSTAILALLHRRLERLGIDDPLRPRLRGIYRRTWYVNQLSLDRHASAVRSVQEAGAEPLVVSSWELPILYYSGDLGLRMVPALHLLVRSEHMAAAEAKLRSGGWRLLDTTRHAVRFASPAGAECIVHRRLFHEFARDPEDLGAASVALALGTAAARAPGPADELLVVCITGARMHSPRGILWIADAAAVVAAAGTDVDWPRLVWQAQRLHATLRVRDALTYLREEIGVAIPAGVVEELEATPTSRRELLAHRTAGKRAGVTGPPPESLIRFLNVIADRSLGRALGSLPSFLRDEWGLERRSQVPLRVARKGAARLLRSSRPQ
jgi:Uncharacterised nucleotidyltransferase